MAVLVSTASLGGLAGCEWVGSSGTSSRGGPYEPSISSDGRYVAYSHSAFGSARVHDMRTGAIQSLDRTADGSPASSSEPSLDGDGRFVAFSSPTAWVPGDTNSVSDVYVKDLVAGTTTRVSVDSLGGDADGGSRAPAISADGRHVAFVSSAGDLVGGDTNGAVDLFVRDLVDGVTTQLTGADGAARAGVIGDPDISPDGRFVAFASDDPGLVAGDGNGVADVFLADVESGDVTRVSVDASGQDANGASGTLGAINRVGVSSGGRHVAFSSTASDLVEGDDNGFADVFVRDTVSGRTQLVSVDVAGGPSDGVSTGPDLSDDGRFVAFHSSASDLVAIEEYATQNIYVRDLTSQRTDLQHAEDSAPTDPFPSGPPSYRCCPALSGDGRYVAFEMSNVSNTVLVRFTTRPRISSVEPASLAPGSTQTVTITGSGFLPDTGLLAAGEGVRGVGTQYVDATTLRITVEVAPDAAPGPRDLWLANPGAGPGVLAGSAEDCVACLHVG